MTRCDVSHCDMPIGAAGYTCVVCQRSFCAQHTGLCADLKCCENDARQCIICLQVKPANQGADIGPMDWMCSICLNGHAILSVELGRADVCELMPPLRPIYEESPNEVVA